MPPPPASAGPKRVAQDPLEFCRDTANRGAASCVSTDDRDAGNVCTDDACDCPPAAQKLQCHLSFVSDDEQTADRRVARLGWATRRRLSGDSPREIAQIVRIVRARVIGRETCSHSSALAVRTEAVQA